MLSNRISVLILAGALFAAAGCSRDESPVTAPSHRSLDLILTDDFDAPNPFDIHLDQAPDTGCRRIPIYLRGQLRQLFNDSNHVHLEAARALGINPVTDDRDILRLRRPLERVRSCREFYLDSLTHSFPYLVPEAAVLLHDIGQAFNDSLAARGGGNYRIKVTSVLRTPVTVKRLRRVNRNATSESTHVYGTTFDISYSKFICDSLGAPARTFEDLKNLLAEVLLDMKRAGRCYVKYEYKQSCFHITTRPKQ